MRVKTYFLKLYGKESFQPVNDICRQNRWNVVVFGADFFIILIPEKDEEIVKSLPHIKIAGEVSLANVKVRKIRVKEE
ncbi:hypothetical protein [Persephonella sp.]